MEPKDSTKLKVDVTAGKILVLPPDATVNYCQIIEMTDEEKTKAYMKLSKKELTRMLIECNRLLSLQITPNILYVKTCPTCIGVGRVKDSSSTSGETICCRCNGTGTIFSPNNS